MEDWTAEIRDLEKKDSSDVEIQARIGDLKLRIAHLVARNNKRKQILQYYNTECVPSSPLSPLTPSDGSPTQR